MMKLLTAFIILLAAVMGSALAYAFHSGDFFAEGELLFAMPWGVVSLIDVYIGFAFIGLWIFWRETSALKAALCFLPILALGNFYTCLYILYAIYTSAGDMHTLINGRRR